MYAEDLENIFGPRAGAHKEAAPENVAETPEEGHDTEEVTETAE